MRAFFSAGEPSGDQRASEVIRALRTLNPGIRIDALGGPLMEQAGAHITHDLVQAPLIGLTSFLPRILYFKRVLRDTVAFLKAEQIDVLVLVDYPGFNLRLAEAARREGIHTVYYIGPQIWAWGAGRIHRIKRAVERMLVVFDFEKPLYEEAGVPVEHVGHPLLDQLDFRKPQDRRKDWNLEAKTPLLGLFPGSRAGEVKRIFGVMLAAGAKAAEKIQGLQMACAVAPDVPLDRYERELSRVGVSCMLLQGEAHKLMQSCDLALVASGTATLETALFGTPQLILYRTDPITAILARMLVKIPGIGLVNVLAGAQVVPEFLQGNCRPGPVAHAAVEVLRDPQAAERSRNLVDAVASKLGVPGGAARAAKAILEVGRQ